MSGHVTFLVAVEHFICGIYLSHHHMEAGCISHSILTSARGKLMQLWVFVKTLHRFVSRLDSKGPLHTTTSPPSYSIEPRVYIASSSEITSNSLLAECYKFATSPSISLGNSRDSLISCYGLRPSMNLLANLLAKVQPYPSYHPVQPDDLSHSQDHSLY